MSELPALQELIISIHALHEESDGWTRSSIWLDASISIHALHEESDENIDSQRIAILISIHALHEESDSIPLSTAYTRVRFQSTLSMRRATMRPPPPRWRQGYFNPRSP